MNDPTASRRILQEYAMRRKQAFLAPDYQGFGESCKREIPEGVRILYDFKDQLLNTPIEVPGEHGSLGIQYFLPLSAETMTEAGRYGWNYFPIAVGTEGERILISLTGDMYISIDYNNGAIDIEATQFTVNSIISWLSEYSRTCRTSST